MTRKGSARSATDGRIRRARATDDAALLQLEELFPTDRISMRSVRRFLSAANAHIWVAEFEGAVVGNLILLTRKRSRVARVYSLVVAPMARGRRLGQRLVSIAEAAARRLKLSAISLEVRADNEAARALYAKLGFAEIEPLPAYYEDGSAGLRLCKVLSK